jgi:hypothetical protein
MQPGGQVLLFPCPEAAKECPVPLGVEAQASASVGEPVPVSVKRYNTKGEASPAAGATITGAVTTVSTNSTGHATVSFSGQGMFTLGVSAPESVRTEANVCVHVANDGHCGTPRTTNTVNTTNINQTNTHTTIVPQPQAGVASVVGIKNGHVYSRRAAPRLLRGTVLVPAGGLLRKVQISLKRRYRGRCFYFSGSRARFVRIRCGKAAPFFSVGTQSSFSYLLPARLPKGRYTYEIEAVDGAGNTTKLVNGVSRVVFSVR